MSELREFQRAFSDVVRGQSTSLESTAETRGLPAVRRLQVYRNNYLESLLDAMASVYPAVQRLVGEESFRGTVLQYIKSHTPCSGDIHDYGQEFSSFLRSLIDQANLQYVIDVARFEWLYHCVFHAEEKTILDVSALGSIPEQDLDRFILELHPASALFESAYPVISIWQLATSATDGDNDEIEVTGGGTLALIARRRLEMEFQLLDRPEYEFLSAVDAGKSILVAFETVSRSYPTASPEEILLKNHSRGNFTGYRIATTENTTRA